MAKQVVLIDDLTKDVIEEGLGGGTLKFSINEKRYSIDMGTKNTDAFFKAIQKYVDAAEEEIDAPRSGRRSGNGSSPTSRGSSGSGRSKEELAAAREWLTKNGHAVSDRGRIKAELLEIFDEAHKS